MTIAKQDPVAWRKRVDQKLNTLTKDFKVLASQQEAINEKFLKLDISEISDKLDKLLSRHEKPSLWVKIGRRIHLFFTSAGSIGWGVAALIALTMAVTKAGTLTEALQVFIHGINGG